MIQVKEVIVTDMARKGTGKDITSPIRAVFEVYTKNGELLAFHDTSGNYSIEEMIEFSNFRLLNKDLPIEKALQQWKPYKGPPYNITGTAAEALSITDPEAFARQLQRSVVAPLT